MGEPATPISIKPETTAEKIARLEGARAEREADKARAHEAHRLLCLELDDRYSTELGPRGQAFELVNEDNTCGEGPIVLKLGDPATHKLWQSKQGASPEDAFAYVKDAVVYPEPARFAAIAVRRPQLLLRATAAMTSLFGFSEGVLRGKY